MAGQSDANTQSNMGLLYAHPQDYLKALVSYHKAADQGVSAVQYNLAAMYANGQGVQRSAEEASKWFLKAARRASALHSTTGGEPIAS